MHWILLFFVCLFVAFSGPPASILVLCIAGMLYSVPGYMRWARSGPWR